MSTHFDRLVGQGGGGIPTMDEILDLLMSGADFTTKLLIIVFGEPKSKAIYNRPTAKRDLAAERAASGITYPSNIHEWQKRFGMYKNALDLTPALTSRIFIDLMVMYVCTLETLATEFKLPETCYNNTIADININGGKPEGIDAHFDMFTWWGLLQVIGLSYLYNGVNNFLDYAIEMFQFIGWYGLDSNLAAGSAVFLWGGFDFIGGKYFWGLV